MISLDYKGFYWERFDENQKPINSKECQIIFNHLNGGEIRFLLDIDEEYDELKYNKSIPKFYGLLKSSENKISKPFTITNLKLIEPPLWQINSGLELTELRYSIEYIFLGTWLQNEKSLDMMHIRFSYIELFLNKNKIKQAKRIEKGVMAGIMAENEIIEWNSKDYPILFNIDNTFEQTEFINKTVTYESKNYLAIAKKEIFFIEDAIRLSLVVKNFFEIITFYSKNKIFIEEFKVSNKDDVITVLFKQDDYKEEQKMSHLDFLFRYDDVKENFVAILNNWIENHDKNQNEYQAFCNVIADKSSKFNIYSHYFQLISALEAYHRLQNKDIEKQEEEKHKVYLQDLKIKLDTCLNSSEKKKILYKLKYQYGTNFKERLKNLVEISKIKEVIICDDIIHNNVIEFIYKMRNQVAHLKNAIKLSQQLKSSFEYLKLLSLLIMLKDISLNEAQISQKISDMNIKFVQKQLIEAFEHYDVKVLND